jgi:phospholipase A1/A2
LNNGAVKNPLGPAKAIPWRRLGLWLLLSVLNLAIHASAPAQTNISVAPMTRQSPATNAPLPSAFMEFIGRHVSGYEPIYFLLGTYPGAEFQFSLKYRLFDLEHKWDPLAHAYIACTQTSFWDLFSSDPSFYDTSYKPSEFLYYPDIFEKNRFQLDLQGGVEHESNGKGGIGERSLNTVYLQPTARFDLPAHLQLTLQPRAWVYFNLGSNNPDMAEYRGYADLLAALTWTSPGGEEKIQFATKFRIGDEGRHAGLQFDLRFNLPEILHFNPTIQLQYFTGYGQTLRQYNQHSSAFRAGLCIWH